MPRRLRPLPWLRDHPFTADALLAAGLLAFSVPGYLSPAFDLPNQAEPDALGLVLLVTVTAPVALRRRRTVLAYLVSLGGLFGLLGIGYSDGGAATATLILAYSVAAHVPWRQAVWVLGATVPALVVFFVLGMLEDKPGANLANLFGTLLIFGIAWSVGDMLRRRRRRVAALEARAQRLEREQALLAAQVAAHERARLARELHDVVAHAVSLMTVQAGGARRIVTRDPQQAADVLATIEATGREAMAELRRLLGVLRSGTESDDTLGRDPQPTLAEVATLVDADPSLPVELRVEGQPVPLPTIVDLSAFRIVQEALTNVRKHAGPAQVQVVLRYGDDALEVEVADDGRGASAAPSPEGQGLVGMRERAALCGGHVVAGPRPGGGWLVRARLPLQRVAA